MTQTKRLLCQAQQVVTLPSIARDRARVLGGTTRGFTQLSTGGHRHSSKVQPERSLGREGSFPD